MATTGTILDTLEVWKNVGKNPALVIVASFCLVIIQIFMAAAGKKIRKSTAEKTKNDQKQQDTNKREEEASSGYDSALDKAKNRRQ